MLDNMRISDWTGKPLALYNLYEQAQSNDPETAVRLFLKPRARMLGLQDPDLADLTLRTSRTSLAGTNLRFTQYFKGVPVYESETVVNLSPSNHITFMMNGYKAITPTFDVTAAITQAQARDLIANYIGLSGQVDLDRTQLVVYKSHNTTRLAWHVRLVGTEPIGDWEALVDANTAEIFKCKDIACYYSAHDHGKHGGNDGGVEEPAYCVEIPLLPPPPPATVNGTGSTFDPDPLSTSGQAYAGQYVDGTDATNASLQAQVRTRTLNSITLNAGVHSLVGALCTDHGF